MLSALKYVMFRSCVNINPKTELSLSLYRKIRTLFVLKHSICCNTGELQIYTSCGDELALLFIQRFRQLFSYVKTQNV